MFLEAEEQRWMQALHSLEALKNNLWLISLWPHPCSLRVPARLFLTYPDICPVGLLSGTIRDVFLYVHLSVLFLLLKVAVKMPRRTVRSCLFVCLFILVRSCFCTVWIFQFEPLKAEWSHRTAEIHFSYGPPIDHLQFWLECFLIGKSINERRRSNTDSKENDCSCIWVTDSEALFYLVCDGNSTAKGLLFWSTDVWKSLSLSPHSTLTHEASAVSFHFLRFYIFPDPCTHEQSQHQTLSSTFLLVWKVLLHI